IARHECASARGSEYRWPPLSDRQAYNATFELRQEPALPQAHRGSLRLDQGYRGTAPDQAQGAGKGGLELHFCGRCLQLGSAAEADRGDGMTRRTPGFARALVGRWRITEMDKWDEIDLLGRVYHVHRE